MIVLDGGKGQLDAATSGESEAVGIDTPVIGLAKRMEEIYVEGQTDPIIIDPHEPALQLLQFYS